MTLRELMGGDAPDVEITGLHYSSSDVRPGGLFFCVPGFKVDGHDFAPDAVERGAAAIVSERPLGLDVPEVVVASARAAMGPAAASFYGDPTAKLSVVGITGTNGKTTTAFLTRAILERGGLQTGLLGTVKSIVGGAELDCVGSEVVPVSLESRDAEEEPSGPDVRAAVVQSGYLHVGRVPAHQVAESHELEATCGC